MTRPRDRIRTLGLVLLPTLFAEGAIGVLSAATGGAGVSPYFPLHAIFGTILVALAGGSVIVARRGAGRVARISTGVTFASALAAGVLSEVFVFTGVRGDGVFDRVLALASLAGALTMLVVGSGRRVDPDSPRAPERAVRLDEAPRETA